ncbi:DUF3899 domain-containing protein [Gracilibacillus oryzae]|uniref:DUF3899 domain-containing protein n=1 Tax=Gracilibacillus oryzae TaxID=1672701 RepID=A0A7C8KXU7_9BACI|nr:DUF3899 domain-containing protein [Gracilibacillus oryzae]
MLFRLSSWIISYGGINVKYHLPVFIVNCLVCLILNILLYKEITIVHNINISFYLSGLYLGAGLLLFVISRGFFDITASSFKKVFTRTNKQQQWQDQWQDNRKPSEKININVIKFFLVQGGLMFLVMVVLLVIYF